MASDTAHGEAQLPEVRHAPPSIGPRQYVMIGVILTVITAVELWVSYSGLDNLIIPLLLVLSAVKFVMVVAFFMHLKFDHPVLTRFFAFGFILAASILFALIALFWTDHTITQPAAGEGAGAAGAGGHGAAGAGGDVSVDQELEVGLGEFFVNVTAEVSAGGTQFNAINEGAVPHNLRVIRTDAAPDALPVSGAVVDEAQVDIVASVGDLNGGASGSATATLEAGSYLLICNVPGHYQLGMVTPMTVQ